MLKILVTGSNGQLGNQLKEIAGLHNNCNFLFTDLPELDITSEEMVEKVLLEFQPDWIINCAAYTAVDKAETDQTAAQKLNAEAPALLAKLSAVHNARMIHISTDYVFDGKNYRPYTESDTKNPNGIYATTKALGEDFVMKANPKAVIIRTSWLYSVYGHNFMKTVLRLASEKGSMRIVCDQIGTPTWTGDLAAGIMAVVEQNIGAGIYHFSNEGVCSWYDFAKAIVELQHIKSTVLPINTNEYPLPAPRPYYSVLDKSLFKATTGISIPHWRDSLKQCLNQLNEQSRA